MASAPPTIVQDLSSLGDDVYHCEALVGKRIRKGKGPKAQNVLEYQVKWAGFTDKHNTWEPASNILDPNMIAAFEKRQQEQTKNPEASSSARGKRKARTSRTAKSRKKGAPRGKKNTVEEEGSSQDEDDEKEKEPIASQTQQDSRQIVAKKEDQDGDAASPSIQKEEKKKDSEVAADIPSTADPDQVQIKEEVKREDDKSEEVSVIKRTPDGHHAAPVDNHNNSVPVAFEEEKKDVQTGQKEELEPTSDAQPKSEGEAGPSQLQSSHTSPAPPSLTHLKMHITQIEVNGHRVEIEEAMGI